MTFIILICATEWFIFNARDESFSTQAATSLISLAAATKVEIRAVDWESSFLFNLKQFVLLWPLAL